MNIYSWYLIWLWQVIAVTAFSNHDGARSPVIYDPKNVIPRGAKVNYYEWNVTVQVQNVDGMYRQIFLINGQMPGPQLEGDQGDWVVVKVNNYLPVPITIHWHGIHQRKTPWSDGTPGVTQWPILSGDCYTYVFELEQYGFYWYHAHFRGYSNDGLVGPVYIRPSDQVERPYEKVSKDKKDIELFTKLEKSPQLLLFNDLFKNTYDTVAAKMFDYGMDPTCVRTFLTNGKGRHLCLDESIRYSQSDKKIKKMQAITSSSKPVSIDAYGCLNWGKLNGFTSFDYDKSGLEFPGHNTDCTNSTTDREVLFTNNEDYVMLNILNMGGEFSKMLSIDDHNITVIAIDGEFIVPTTGQQVYLPIGQRVTALVKTDPRSHKDTTKPFAIRTACNDMPQLLEGLAFLYYGTADSAEDVTKSIHHVNEPKNGVQYQNYAGEFINKTDSSSYVSIDPRRQRPYNHSLTPPKGPANVTIYLYLNRLAMTVFAVRNNVTMNGGMELDYPVLHRTAADPLRSLNLTQVLSQAFIDEGIKYNDVVDIIFQNSNLADHPMHIHGHTFWAIALNDSSSVFPYNTVKEALKDGRQDLFDFETAPYVDNIAVLTAGYGIIRFVADNPGIWMIHCHVQTHLSAGMAAAFVEAKESINNIPVNLFFQNHANYNSMFELTPSELNITLS